MSSFPRTLQRRRIRAAKDYEPRPQYTEVHEDGGYRTLHPTKGWQTVSVRRVTAMQATEIFELQCRLRASVA